MLYEEHSHPPFLLPAPPKAASCAESDHWQVILTAMSKSVKKDEMHFNLDTLTTTEKATEMISHLSPSIEVLLRIV